jgi:hypothetical protein
MTLADRPRCPAVSSLSSNPPPYGGLPKLRPRFTRKSVPKARDENVVPIRRRQMR